MCDNPTSMHYLHMEARMEAYNKSRETPSGDLEVVILSHEEMLEQLDLPEGVAEWSDEGMDLFKAWCKKSNTWYYGKHREHFDEVEGMRQASNAGASQLYMEDLS